MRGWCTRKGGEEPGQQGSLAQNGGGGGLPVLVGGVADSVRGPLTREDVEDTGGHDQGGQWLMWQTRVGGIDMVGHWGSGQCGWAVIKVGGE